MWLVLCGNEINRMRQKAFWHKDKPKTALIEAGKNHWGRESDSLLAGAAAPRLFHCVSANKAVKKAKKNISVNTQSLLRYEKHLPQPMDSMSTLFGLAFFGWENYQVVPSFKLIIKSPEGNMKDESRRLTSVKINEDLKLLFVFQFCFKMTGLCFYLLCHEQIKKINVCFWGFLRFFFLKYIFKLDWWLVQGVTTGVENDWKNEY